MPPPTSAQLAELIASAQEAAQRAYAPYSSFFVGAAVLLETGAIVCGCNVENASYRLTTCAEQNAIASAVARYGPQIRLSAVAVRNRNAAACQPCGACRQTIAEFAGHDAVILFPGADGKGDRCTLIDLLPSSFSLQPNHVRS